MAPTWTPSDYLTNIDNSSCSITCVGYAPSQGRRCHQRIAAANCQDAAEILSRISKLKLSSSGIDDLLRQLAPRVLCKRYHQNQSSRMISQWQEDINSLLVEEFTEEAERVRRDRAAAQNVAEAARFGREPATLVSNHRTDSDESASKHTQHSLTETKRLASELCSMTARVAALEEEIQELRRSNRTHRFVESQVVIVGAEEHCNSDLDQVPASEYFTAPDSPLSSTGGIEDDNDDEDVDDERKEAEEDIEGKEEQAAEDEGKDGDGQAKEQIEDQHHGTISGDCPICLESFGCESGLISCRAQCGQPFHLDCLGIWLATDEHTWTCPYCRADWV